MAALNTTAINNALASLSLRPFAAIPDDQATHDLIAKTLKNPPTEEQISRLKANGVFLDKDHVPDLCQPLIRTALNLMHTSVFPQGKMEELREALNIAEDAEVSLNEFHPVIRKAMKLPHFAPRNVVAQYFARLRIAENKEYSAETADRGKAIEETSEGPLSSHHVNEILSILVKHYIAEADIAHYLPCKYDTREQYFNVIAAIIERGDADLVAELEDRLVRAAVDVYYTAARPDVYELFSHMAANELMIIDGDSLILAAMSNANVDWDLMQSLHVAHLVNKFVMDLKKRGAKIHIAFFKCHAWFWAKSPQKRLVRNIIKNMLSSRCDQPDSPFEFFEFASYYNAQFEEYLSVHSPEFIVLNDGEEMYPLPVEENGTAAVISPKPFVSVLGCDELGTKAAAALHRMMIHFVANRIHVVYTARQIHKDNNIFGFTVRASSAFFVPFEPLRPTLESQSRQDAKANAIETEIDEIDEEVSEAVAGARNNALLLAAVAGKFVFEEADAATKAVVKALIITSVAQAQLAIQTRYQNIDSGAASAARFVAITNRLASLMADASTELEAVRAKDYDAFDGHLVAAIGLICTVTAPKDLLSEDLCEQIDAAWAAVTGDEDATISDKLITDLPAIAHKPASKEGPFMYYDHELVKHLCNKYDVQELPTGSRAPAPLNNALITKAMEKFARWTPNHNFLEYNAVISEREEKEKKEAEDEKAAKNRRYRDKLKAVEARFYAAIDETARSMNVLESKVTTGKKIVADATADASSTTKHGAAAKNASGTVSRGQIIQDTNAVNLITKAISEAMERTRLKVKLCRERGERYDPLTASLQQTTDMMRVLKETTDYASTLDIISGSDAHVRAELFRLACKKGSDGREPYTFICDKTNNARGIMERIAKEGCKKAEDLAAMEKKFARKRPSDAEAAKMEELRESILVNEPNPDRAGYFAARAYASMFQRYAKFELYWTVQEVRRQIWSVVKTQWCNECDVLRTPEEKAELLETKSWAPAVEAWLSAHKILDLFEHEPLPVPNLAQIDSLRSVIDNLDLETYRSALFDAQIKKRLKVDSLGAVPQKLRPTCTLPIPMNATTFQLRRMGERLQREVPPTPDPRVVFNADYWQRDLMDIVDNRGSVIVSAPTSSGKTFISYYCMEQVFSQTISADTPTSDIGVVVYVAPTRALINQAASDIYGRYKSKSYGTLPLKVFGALGGRDYVRTPFDCQALITLPDVLETILLSPHNQKWLKRVKYFIFDEIHTMEDSGNGAVWERILSLIRAPFVALSATIGDTNNLLAWLNRAQATQAAQAAANPAIADSDKRIYNVQLIPKDGTTIARWSDIEKHVFIPTTTKPLESLHRDIAPQSVDRNDIVDFHPLSVATYETLHRKNAFPADLGIVPRETVELVQEMFKAFEPVCANEYGDVPCVADIAKRLEKLSPAVYMKDLVSITQSKARAWEAEAKAELLLWVRMGTPESLAKVKDANDNALDLGPLVDDADIEAFSLRMKEVAESVLRTFSAQALDREETLIKKARSGEMAYPDTTGFIHTGIVRCLYTLLTRNLAPAIIFVLDQEECERLVETVVSALEEAEQAYRDTPAFRAYARKLEMDKEKNNKLKATKASMTHQRESGDDGRNEGDRTVADVGEILPDSAFVIPDVLPEFTFAPMVASDDDIKNALEENPNERRSILFRALQRGIGIHHNGISGKLRGSVERSFRKLLLPFVFSTEGLALGIHSPCRSVVLAGDNIALNVSEFRQMAGRAGRRGLDFLGHVIFFGISVKKIKRLMTGEMANLRGHSQMDPTSALRLLQLYYTAFDGKPGNPTPSEWFESVKRIAELAYVDPLFVRGREESQCYVKDHVAHLRHMMTYLAREGLVNASADAPSSLGNLLVTMMNIRNTARLETAGFALAAMIANEVLGRVSESTLDPSTAEYTKQRTYNVALAISYILTKHHKFHVPLEVHRSIARDAMATFMRKSTSARAHTVFLPPASPAVKSVMELQSGRILKVLSHFVADRARFITTDVTLPLGLISTKNDTVTITPVVPAATTESAAGLAAKLDETAVKNVKARHPFIALCGKNDTFDSVEDIIQSLANGLFLDISDVPAIDHVDLGRHDGAPCVINAAFYDYIRNGSQKRGEDFTRLNLMLYNHLSQSASWGTLTKIFVAVDSLKIAIRDISNEDIQNPTRSAVELLAERCAALRNELDNRPQWKVDARAGVAMNLNV